MLLLAREGATSCNSHRKNRYSDVPFCPQEKRNHDQKTLRMKKNKQSSACPWDRHITLPLITTASTSI